VCSTAWSLLIILNKIVRATAMPRGGKREGAGRKPGVRVGPYRTISKAIPTRATTNLLLQMQGKAPLRAQDALGLLQAAYHNEDLPEAMRLQAAAYAAPYEKPRLNAIDARFLIEEKRRYVDEDAAAKLMAELDRLAHAAEVEAHEAMIENARRGFAGIKQDRIYRETDISLAVKPAVAPPRRREPVVVNADPVEIRPAAEPPVVPLRPLSEQYRHLIRRF